MSRGLLLPSRAKVIARGGDVFRTELDHARRLGFKCQHVIGDPVPPDQYVTVSSRLLPVTPAAHAITRRLGSEQPWLEARARAPQEHAGEALRDVMRVLLDAAADAA